MTEKRDRPLLVGGAVVALGIGLLDVLNQTLGEWSVYAVFLGAAGAVVWWVKRSTRRTAATLALPQIVDQTAVKQALGDAERVILQLGEEVANPQEPGSIANQPQVSRFQSQISQIATGIDREEIQIMVLGGSGSGKSTLLAALQSEWATASSVTVHLSEAPAFASLADTADSVEEFVQQQAMGADLVLFLVNGDITEPEYRAVKHLASIRRTLLVFNKQDQYLPEERQTVLMQLQKRGQEILKAGDVVAIAAAPNPIKVRQHQEDGSVQEWLEDQMPDLAALTQRLDQILQQDAKQLVLNSSFHNAQALRTQAKSVLNNVRRARALPLVEQYQWIAAGTAFASPLPAVDLVATVAINGQMIMNLGTIYRQQFSLQQAQKVAATLGSVMLKLGLVELSTRAIAAFLKSNAVTYLAGGCIQGISAAYLTRVAGLSLIEYFHTQEPNLSLAEASPLAVERFSQILQQVFQQNQQGAFLQAFIQQALSRLSSFMPQPASVPTQPDISPLAIPSQSEALQPLVLTPPQETEDLDQNGTGVRLSLPELETIKIPSA